ncbi:phosphate signaling complex protein PhoU [Falsarthrobacter nasiphocae]|uniref:Phosphate-specific transport system accessory protein PhoU n=1 Tax=Falsarthrobacter nasiphocae TaxID=189863 RepID=A0AAE3YGK0_9MICC|nr:phosphate signaling complex protein PhoU [Falsarthrobacter nasiphocae]MDR6891769.1 phosphate transport system protein [Falsarthrobacter nasiphocae]
MRKAFQEELATINDELIKIAELVTAALEQAVQALESSDTELAQNVIAADAKIDFVQHEVDERSIDVLALEGPVASDLRFVVGTLRMSISLERMGDLARHVAQLVRLRYPADVLPEAIRPTFRELAALDLEIAKDLVELLRSRDLTVANRILTANTRVNELHASVFQQIASEDWQGNAATSVDVALASRYFERFADHGVSVARKVSYLVSGDWEPFKATAP